MNYLKLGTILFVGLLSSHVSMSQVSDFDLSSQRKESADVPKLTGHQVDHKGLIINPVPNYLNLSISGTLDVTAGVKLSTKLGQQKRDIKEDLSFLPLQSAGVPLNIALEKIVKSHAVKPVSGAYSLRVHQQGIDIVGYDDAGVYYGIQTLRQIMESPIAQNGKTLPYLEVNDYPVFPYRGIIEGFYGTPWSHKVRLSLIDFYGKYKLNTYVYGPKDDPYHSSPNWRKPYPADEAKNIHELVEACDKNRVEFVWAIHPGKDIKWNEEDYNNLKHKFDLMYQLGVRSFAIFFDDISGDGTNPARQVELLNRLTKEFVKVKGDVSPLIICPTDYSRAWANPTPEGSLSVYGRTLDPSVRVFWTGDVVCSDVTRTTLAWVNSRIKRPALFWWNYPVTDYVRHIVLQGPVYGLENTVTAGEMTGLLSNPMEHGEASKLALYSVADYAWNPTAYNALDSWERALAVMAPQAKDAYRTFAIHSADTETGYRRDESWETTTFSLDHYTPKQYDDLMREFEKIEKVPSQLEQGLANRGLFNELRPWLTEFGKLGTRGKNALKLMEKFKHEAPEGFWNSYVQNLMSAEDKKAYDAHRSGTMKLQPFYEKAMEDMSEAFYEQLAGKKSAIQRPIGSYPSVYTTQSKNMLDADSLSFYHSGIAQKTGDWVGLDLGKVMPIWEVDLKQGRNATDDVDYFDHAILECSADGQTWHPLIADLQKQYDIHWTGQGVQGRYVRLRKLPSEKTHWLAIRTFKVNPITVSRLDFDVQTAQGEKAIRAFDEQPLTSFHLAGTLSFGIPKHTQRYVLLMKLSENRAIRVKQHDKKGRVVAETTVSSSFHQLDVAKKAARLSIEGDAEIFEIIRK